MTNIKILGTGCKQCVSLQENVEAALEEQGVEADVQRVEDINEIVQFGVMSTPALVINDEVKVVGKVAATQEMIELLPR